MDRVRFGVVGCGAIGPWHAKAIADTPEAVLTACCDVIEDRAAALAAKYGNAKVYTDYTKLLEDEVVDAVCICTPSGLHGRIAIDAAAAGKHIICEKPLEITLPKIDAMIDACDRAGVKLAAILQRRTSPMWHVVKQAIDCGHLGKMVLGDAYLKYYRSQEYYDSDNWRGTWELDGGGALMNQGVHLVDILRWIMGPVESVFAYADHLVRDIEVEDTVCAVLRFTSGAMGILEAATSVTPGMDHRLEFHGSTGSILIEGDCIKRWAVPGREDAQCTAAGNGGVDIKIGTAHTAPTSSATAGHQIQIADLCKSIYEDREPMVTGMEARKSVELILAIYESARIEEPVNLQSAVKNEQYKT